VFDEDMTSQDLCDLGETTFLLWWQNIEPPKVKDKGKKNTGKEKKTEDEDKDKDKDKNKDKHKPKNKRGYTRGGNKR
jgi:hypothetical protein